jgi:uncharacterized membrane protein
MFEYGIIGYHHLLVHFPTALWVAAFALMVLRAVSPSELSRAGDVLLGAVLILGALAGVAAFVSGFLIWPSEAVTTSPLGRNKLLWSSWTLAYWVVLTVVYLWARPLVWQAQTRWLMPLLGLIGLWMMSITGGLGGHLVGQPTAWSTVLRWLGWDIYRTFFMPTYMLLVTLVAAAVIVALGILGRRAAAGPRGARSRVVDEAVTSPRIEPGRHHPAPAE